MPHLVKYGLLSTVDNTKAGYLVKAQCDICGKKYGSVEEAKKCESKHFEHMVQEAINKGR